MELAIQLTVRVPPTLRVLGPPVAGFLPVEVTGADTVYFRVDCSADCVEGQWCPYFSISEEMINVRVGDRPTQFLRVVLEF